MKDPRDVILRPVVSEKSYGLIDGGVYTFVVAEDTNKTEIKQAIEAIFSVKVSKVNTLNRKGKAIRNRKSGVYTSRPNTKRAIVTLAGDDRIELFEN
jgi:large subunit ribosomal protein L23